MLLILRLAQLLVPLERLPETEEAKNEISVVKAEFGELHCEDIVAHPSIARCGGRLLVFWLPDVPSSRETAEILSVNGSERIMIEFCEGGMSRMEKDA
jgi:hypothetical protein